MKFAYADPPYLGQGRKHYSKDHPEAALWDSLAAHKDLINRLVDEFPDGWALSLSSPSLKDLLPLCPDDVRVMAWVKPFAVFKPGVNPAYAWEPVIVRGGRLASMTSGERRKLPTVRDWVSANVMLKKGLTGAKPEGFCTWLFSALGAQPGDELVDLFPGTGAVTDAWKKWTSKETAA